MISGINRPRSPQSSFFPFASNPPIAYVLSPGCVVSFPPHAFLKGYPMKSLFGAAALVVCTTMSFSQIPNAGFEIWSGGNPDGWATSNVVDVATPVTQSVTARSGSSAARGEVVAFPDIGAIQPLLQSGVDATGFQVSQRHATLSGYYQFSPQSGDQFTVNCGMYKGQSAVGIGAAAITAAAGTYTQFDVMIEYFTDDVPDTCIIQFMIIGPTGADYHLGSWVLIDDLSFSGTVTGIGQGNSQPIQFALAQNFPNPFNPSTKISFDLSEPGITTLVVYDLLGRQVATLASGFLSAGTHSRILNAEHLPSGVYVYQLRSGSFQATKRLVVVR